MLVSNLKCDCDFMKLVIQSLNKNLIIVELAGVKGVFCLIFD